MNFERQDIGLGLFVLGAAAAVIAGLITVAGILKGETIDIHVLVDSVANVRVGTIVYVRGYRVGEITDIDPVYEPTLHSDVTLAHFDVTLAIDAEFPLYDGTRAIISSSGFIGDVVLNLQLPETLGRRLVSGDRIGQATSMDISSVVGRADTLARAVEEVAARLVELLSPEVAGAILAELRNTLVTTRENLTLIENRFVAISDSLARGMQVATNSLKLVSDVLQESRPRISSMLDSTQTLVSELRSLTSSAGSLLESQGPAIGRNLAELEAVLAQLRILLADMNRHSLWQMMFKTRPPDTSTVRP